MNPREIIESIIPFLRNGPRRNLDLTTEQAGEARLISHVGSRNLNESSSAETFEIVAVATEAHQAFAAKNRTNRTHKDNDRSRGHRYSNQRGANNNN